VQNRPPEGGQVPVVDPDRISGLFREREALALAQSQAAGRVTGLTERYNQYIAAGNRASTSTAKAREYAMAERTAQEAERARGHNARLAAQLHGKEAEIADLIAAMWAATEPLRSGEPARQVLDEVRAIAARMDRVDGQVAQLAHALLALRDAMRVQGEAGGGAHRAPVLDALDEQAAAIAALRETADSAVGSLTELRREVRHQSDSLRAIGGALPGQGPVAGLPAGGAAVGEPRYRASIVQLGWSPDMPAPAGPHSTTLPPAVVAALPERIRVLLFASEMGDRPRPDLVGEIREIAACADQPEFGGRLTLRAWLAAQAFDLVPTVNRHRPHVIQFSGYGRADGGLLTGPRERSEPVATDRLMQMLRWAGARLRVVFFHLADSAAHGLAAAQLADAAIGLDGGMDTRAAHVFAARLYSALACGDSVLRAFHRACAAIGDRPDALVPQLFFREGVDPHAIVLVRPPAVAAA